MGNIRSGFLCKDVEVDYNAYVVEEWRSARSRDLDRLGGLERPALKRGDSMTARLEFLQISLLKQGQEMEDALHLNPAKRPDRQTSRSKYLLRTDIRAMEREQDAQMAAREGQGRDVEPASALPLSWAEQQEREKQAKASARSKALDYARKAQAEVQHGAGATRGPKSPTKAGAAGTEDGAAAADGGAAAAAAVQQQQAVALWRLRVHAARRRAIMVVLTIVRLKAGRNHPQRIQRVDSFSYCIPLVLKSDLGRFTEEQLRYLAISADMKGCKEALEEVLQLALRQGMQRASGGASSASVSPSSAASASLGSKIGAFYPSHHQPRVGSGRALKMSSRSHSDPVAAAVAEGRRTRALAVAAGSRMLSLTARGEASGAAGDDSGSERSSGGGGPAAGKAAAAPVLSRVVEEVISSGPSMTSVIEPPAVAGAAGSARTSKLSVATTLADEAPAQQQQARGGGGASAPRRAAGPWAAGPQRASDAGGKDHALPSIFSPKVTDMFAFSPRAGTGAAVAAPAAAAAPVAAPTAAAEAGSGPSFTFPSKPGQDVPEPGWMGSAPAGASNSGDSSTRSSRGSGSGTAPCQQPKRSSAVAAPQGAGAHHTGGAAWEVEAGQQPSWNRSNSDSGMMEQWDSKRPSSDGRFGGSGVAVAAPRGGGAGGRAALARGSGGRGRAAGAPAAGRSGAGAGSCADPDVDARDIVVHLSSPISGVTVGSSSGGGGSSGGKAERGGVGSARTRSSAPAPKTVPLAAEVPVASEKAKVDVLSQRMEHDATRLSRCEMMLGMYVNRANAAWAEAQGGWSPAQALDQEDLHEGEDLQACKAEVVRKLKMGQIVFQIFASEDELPLPGGGSLDLWTSDPWAVVAGVRPGSMPLTGERLEGLPLGGRVLTQLRAAVEYIAGHEAASALLVVLHLHDGQLEAALKDLCNRRHYGLKRENVLVTVQQRRPGYRFDPTESQFVPVDAADVGGCERRSLGPGYGMMQMGWVGDTFTVGDACTCVPLKDSLLEHLQKRKAEWLVSRRCCDLSLHTPEGAVDVTSLAQALQLRQRARATVVTQVLATPNVTAMRQLDSLLLSPKSGAHEALLVSPFKRSKAVTQVHELRCCETSSAVMADVLAKVKDESGGVVLAGLHRYAFHLPSLAATLANVNVFRPKLVMDSGAVRIALELSDLTSAPKAKCMAMSAPELQTSLLLSSKEVEDLIPLAQAQDSSYEFRGAAGAAHVATARLASVSGAATSAPGSPARVVAGHRVVVFCADNDVTTTAVEFVAMFARAGRDEVYLVTVVPSEIHQARGSALLGRLAKQLSHHLIHPKLDVVIKGYAGLLDSLESYATSCDASLVVMGSQAIVSQSFLSTLAQQQLQTSTAMGTGASSAFLSTAAIVGSVTLSCIRRLRLPMAIVTPQTRLLGAQGSVARSRAPRAMALVEPHARGMLNYLCSNCLDPLRGDRLYLGQVFAPRTQTTTQQTTSRRVMNDFVDVSTGHHLSPTKLQLEGGPSGLDRALCAAAEAEGLALLALHMRQADKGVPAEVLSLLRSCRAAVLLYRDIATAAE